MSLRAGIDAELRKLASMSPSGYYLALHIRYATPLLAFQTYPQQWIDHYTEQAYALRDPTVAWGFSVSGAARWSEVTIPDPFGIFAQAAEYGLKYGVIVSCGPIASRTIAGSARSDREFDDDEIDAIRDLIERVHAITQPPDNLTQAQIEALKLIAAGDRYSAAAAKLGISESALKARLNSARQTLLARTTAEAVQRAKDYRLI
ncbi:MAG: autoinducer binding domain-containing protein [Rhodobacteraceae bacterium]|nr:autoinducer binding domain-containing protein [Paracoccaceae bacterium]